MSYRGRLTAEVQEALRHGTGRSTHGLNDDQIARVWVVEVDVVPDSTDTYLDVTCTVPSVDPEYGAGDITVRVALGRATALSLLFNALLDETNVATTDRRPVRSVRTAASTVSAEWKFGFGPQGAETAWSCQLCSAIMLRNQPSCSVCSYTVFSPVHRVVSQPGVPPAGSR